ncbi:MAG: MFS transporter [Bacteroidia bacterium]|nr:MFS transporter [Bacteroidia bacterium]
MKSAFSLLRNRNLLLLGLVSLFTDLSSQMIYPYLPLLLTELGANKSVIGLIEGIAEATAALLKSVSGRLADRSGRRKGFVLGGYSLSAFAKPALYLAAAWWQVLAVRFLDRTGKALRNPARDALIAGSVPAADRGSAFGLHRAMDRIGALGGPLLALAVLAAWPGDLRMVFLWSAVPAFIAVALIPFVREAAAAARQPAAGPSGTRILLGSRPFRLFLLANLLFSLGNASEAFLILKAEESGVPPLHLPLLWVMYNAVCVLLAPAMGRLSDRIGRMRVILISFAWFSGVYALFGSADQAWQIWMLFALYGVYYGLSDGVYRAYLADLAAPELRASAYGLFSTATGLALLPASLLMGTLWDQYGSQIAFYAAAGCSAAGMLVMWLGVQQGSETAS